MMRTVMNTPAMSPPKKTATLIFDFTGRLDASLSVLMALIHASLVTELSCVGHCLLKDILKPSTVMEGLFCESIHERSLSRSVEAVTLPSESE